MRERPIIFTAESVRAVLAGRKTQTRRIVSAPVDFVGGQGDRGDLSCWGYWAEDEYGRWVVLARGLDQRYHNGLVSLRCPFGVPGDRLWVRETWQRDECSCERAGFRSSLCKFCHGSDLLVYRADIESPSSGTGWKPSIHMPRWASRLLLEVTEVRVQRLQKITQDEAVAEGMMVMPEATSRVAADRRPWCHTDLPGGHWMESDARHCFAVLWDTINGRRASWASDPFVWTITLKRVS